MTLRLSRRSFIAASAALGASAALAMPATNTRSLLLLADDPAALGWLGTVAAQDSSAAVALAHGPADAMSRMVAHLALPGARILTLLSAPSHLLAQIALRDAGAHQHLELDRASDLSASAIPALRLHQAMGLPLPPPSPAVLAGRSLLAGVMEPS